MIKKILSGTDLTIFSEIGLVIFLGVFIAVSWRALRMRREDTTRNAAIVLNDLPQEEVR
ncbi:MAG: hypothetical protein KF851_04860 [Pirellulaceae bacterium]|jgi:cbb3-type cytochrome oxidase subunit 3|nr:hypothetical protein [Pirellulaceae bacterium]